MAVLAMPWRLRRAGVLGINQRNTHLTLPLNPRRRYPLVDDKALTKELCQQHGIPVPALYAVIERFGAVKHLDRLAADRPEFVIKPARGAGGRGVLVIQQHDGRTFVRSTGDVLTLADVRYHASTILSGLHSLGGLPDRVIIEQRIRPHPVFAPVSVGGTPDVRIIVYDGRPVMAMMRLPTHESSGRANLHQGAVGVGINMATGVTTHAVCHDRPIARHPDTDAPLRGLAVPAWSRQLAIAMRLADVVSLGYIGVDLVIDPDVGPVVLEANARPGLAIQIANRWGLLHSLRERLAGRERKACTLNWLRMSRLRRGRGNPIEGRDPYSSIPLVLRR